MVLTLSLLAVIVVLFMALIVVVHFHLSGKKVDAAVDRAAQSIHDRLESLEDQLTNWILNPSPTESPAPATGTPSSTLAALATALHAAHDASTNPNGAVSAAVVALANAVAMQAKAAAGSPVASVNG